MRGYLNFECNSKDFFARKRQNNSVPSRDLGYQALGLELTLSLVTSIWENTNSVRVRCTKKRLKTALFSFLKSPAQTSSYSIHYYTFPKLHSPAGLKKWCNVSFSLNFFDEKMWNFRHIFFERLQSLCLPFSFVYHAIFIKLTQQKIFDNYLSNKLIMG